MHPSPSIVAAAALAAFAAAGCAPHDAEVRRARLAAEKRNLSETFDRLEDRLVANQARVRLWRELKGRHESVSAIACASQEEHALALAARLEPAPRSSLHRARVASAASAEAPPSRTPARR